MLGRVASWRRRDNKNDGHEALESAVVERILRNHELRNSRRVALARLILFGSIFFFLLGMYGWAVALREIPILVLFILNGFLGQALAKRRTGPVQPYLTVLIDTLLLAYTLLAPERTYPSGWPWQTVLRQPNFIYFFLVLAISAMTFRPTLILWAGACIASVWGAASAYIVSRPGVITEVLPPEAGSDRLLQRYLDPAYSHTDDILVRVFVILGVAVILATAAARVRSLLYQQAQTSRERANLARYVAPSMVDALAHSDVPLGEVREHEAAVMFADIRGFTRLCEKSSPDETMQLLRDVHKIIAEVVFRYRGTLDKFIGDGVMATFGTPEPADDDAARAVDCATALLDAVGRWNRQRCALGQAPVRLGIGLHYGPIMAGDIGGAERFEFAVIGDTVNVASRLERATREVDVELLVSGEIVGQLQRLGREKSAWHCLGERPLRGRDEAVEIWTIADKPAPARFSAPSRARGGSPAETAWE